METVKGFTSSPPAYLQATTASLNMAKRDRHDKRLSKSYELAFHSCYIELEIELENGQYLSPGWYIELAGEAVDLDHWDYTLNEPFDPVVSKQNDGTYLLVSQEVAAATSAEEARQKGLGVIARMNGALRIMNGCRPILLSNVTSIDEAGNRHRYIFAAMSALELHGDVMRATGIALGPDGKPLPPPPPQPSAAQQWNALATTKDDVADLLEQHGRAADWFEIYKTLEIAERLSGGKRKLEKILGATGRDYVNLRETANFYRHARTHQPKFPTSEAEAKLMLNFIVRFVLEREEEKLRLAIAPTPASRPADSADQFPL